MNSILIIRFSRLGRIPVALASAEALIEAGQSVFVVEYGEPGALSPSQHQRIRFSHRWTKWLPRRLRPAAMWLETFLRLIRWFINEGSPRLIVAHGLSEQTLAFALFRLMKIPYVVHVHEVFEEKELHGQNRAFFLFEGVVLRAARHLIFPSHERAQVYVQRYKLTQPISFLPCFPRRLDFLPAPLREFLPPPANAFLIGYWGGLGENGALCETIEALALLPKNVHLILWGWGEEGFLNRLRDLAKRNGVSDRVHLAGQLPEDKWSILSALDLGLVLYPPTLLRLQNPVWASNKLFESLAAGVPPLVGGSHDFAEFLKVYSVGYRAEELTPQGIAQAIQAVVSDPSGHWRRRLETRKLHLSHFHFERQFTEITHVFNEAHQPSFLAVAPIATSS